jgi:hypothetical protein
LGAIAHLEAKKFLLCHQIIAVADCSSIRNFKTTLQYLVVRSVTTFAKTLFLITLYFACVTNSLTLELKIGLCVL